MSQMFLWVWKVISKMVRSQVDPISLCFLYPYFVSQVVYIFELFPLRVCVCLLLFYKIPHIYLETKNSLQWIN